MESDGDKSSKVIKEEDLSDDDVTLLEVHEVGEHPRESCQRKAGDTAKAKSQAGSRPSQGLHASQEPEQTSPHVLDYIMDDATENDSTAGNSAGGSRQVYLDTDGVMASFPNNLDSNASSSGGMDQQSWLPWQRDAEVSRAEWTRRDRDCYFECQFCKKLLSSKSNLCRHIKEQHRNQKHMFPCLQCMTEFSRRCDLRQHYLKRHPDLIEEAEMVPYQVSRFLQSNPYAPGPSVDRTTPESDHSINLESYFGSLGNKNMPIVSGNTSTSTSDKGIVSLCVSNDNLSGSYMQHRKAREKRALSENHDLDLQNAKRLCEEAELQNSWSDNSVEYISKDDSCDKVENDQRNKDQPATSDSDSSSRRSNTDGKTTCASTTVQEVEFSEDRGHSESCLDASPVLKRKMLRVPDDGSVDLTRNSKNSGESLNHPHGANMDTTFPSPSYVHETANTRDAGHGADKSSASKATQTLDSLTVPNSVQNNASQKTIVESHSVQLQTSTTQTDPDIQSGVEADERQCDPGTQSHSIHQGNLNNASTSTTRSSSTAQLPPLLEYFGQRLTEYQEHTTVEEFGPNGGLTRREVTERTYRMEPNQPGVPLKRDVD